MDRWNPGQQLLGHCFEERKQLHSDTKVLTAGYQRRALAYARVPQLPDQIYLFRVERSSISEIRTLSFGLENPSVPTVQRVRSR